MIDASHLSTTPTRIICLLHQHKAFTSYNRYAKWTTRAGRLLGSVTGMQVLNVFLADTMIHCLVLELNHESTTWQFSKRLSICGHVFHCITALPHSKKVANLLSYSLSCTAACQNINIKRFSNNRTMHYAQ